VQPEDKAIVLYLCVCVFLLGWFLRGFIVALEDEIEEFYRVRSYSIYRGCNFDARK
jgi:hypothetical protein